MDVQDVMEVSLCLWQGAMLLCVTAKPGGAPNKEKALMSEKGHHQFIMSKMSLIGCNLIDLPKNRWRAEIWGLQTYSNIEPPLCVRLCLSVFACTVSMFACLCLC